MEIEIIDKLLKEKFESYFKKIDNIEQMLWEFNLASKKNKPTTEVNDVWIPLKKAWELMGINKNKWYRKYKKLIKHKAYGGDVWIHKPSIEKFFNSDNIN